MQIYPWEVIAIILLVAGLIYFRRKNAPPTTRDPLTGRKVAAKVEQTPEEAYMDLRRQAIETDPKHVEKADTLEARGNYVRPSDRLKRE